MGWAALEVFGGGFGALLFPPLLATAARSDIEWISASAGLWNRISSLSYHSQAPKPAALALPPFTALPPSGVLFSLFTRNFHNIILRWGIRNRFSNYPSGKSSRFPSFFIPFIRIFYITFNLYILKKAGPISRARLWMIIFLKVLCPFKNKS